MWGILKLKEFSIAGFRLTPTCVGNTEVCNLWMSSVWAHPHMCGEYKTVKTSSPDCLGSPPHVWGIHEIYFFFGRFCRLTPTCVGNTEGYPKDDDPLEAHPHMCGEYRRLHERRVPNPGSPPHVWGILHGVG